MSFPGRKVIGGENPTAMMMTFLMVSGWGKKLLVFKQEFLPNLHHTHQYQSASSLRMGKEY